MKNFFKALGKAVLYFMVYYVLQVAVTFIFTVIVTVASVFTSPSMIEEDAFTFVGSIMEKTLSNVNLMMVISVVLALFTYWIIFIARKKSFGAEINAVKPRGEHLVLLTIPVGILAQLALSSTMSLLPIPDAMLDEYSNMFALTKQGSVAWEIIATVLAAPICEEVVFRGLVYSRLKKGMPKWAAILIQAVLFGLMHGQALWITYAALAGIGFALAYDAFDSVLAPMLLHIVFNASSYLMAILPDFPGALYVYCAVSIVLLVVMVGYISRKLKGIPDEKPDEMPV